MSKQGSYAPDQSETSKAKAKPKRKTPRPIVVEWRAVEGKFFRKWGVFRKYKDLEVAEEVVRKKNLTDDMFEYRLKPE